jgi:putative copper resistance protein D
VTVALLVATGIVNSYFLIRVQDLAPQALGIYLYLLAAKLVAFAGMLLLAAVHKFRLVPSLENAIGEDRASGAWARLTRSLMLEAALAIAVIGLVAWLGTLPPPSSL